MWNYLGNQCKSLRNSRIFPIKIFQHLFTKTFCLFYLGNTYISPVFIFFSFQLIQFLVTMVQPSRSGLGSMGRRRYQLMINDAPRSSKVWLTNIINSLVYTCFVIAWMCLLFLRIFETKPFYSYYKANKVVPLMWDRNSQIDSSWFHKCSFRVKYNTKTTVTFVFFS